MRTVLIVLGAAFLLTGVVWILQGLDIVRGTFMSGQAFWGWTGVVCAIVGVAALFFAFRGSLIRRP